LFGFRASRLDVEQWKTRFLQLEALDALKSLL
jgi:hypothetical protein